ncbi:MAG: hypothetical protein GJV46_05495 [Geobacter sp.]|nr:hypothetical protein [Geobacter sp.]
MTMPPILNRILIAAILPLTLATAAPAEVPDTNSYWKNFAAAEKEAKHHLDDAMQSCRGKNDLEAQAILKEWQSSLQKDKYPGSDFNPCNGSGSLVADKTTVAAISGRAVKMIEKGTVQTEWDFRARTVKLWFGGDLISLSIGPISVSVLNASLAPHGAQKQFDRISEEQIISGLEAFWRSAHEHYPNHSMYEIALQVITGRNEGREMLYDFIRCGRSLCS